MNFVFVVVACAAVQATADDAHHKSLMRRKVSDADAGAMSLTISDSGGIRGSRDEVTGAKDSQAAQNGRARRQELDTIFSRVHHRFRDVVKSDAFLEADHETFFAAVEGVRKLVDMKMTTGRAGGVLEIADTVSGFSAESHRAKTKWLYSTSDSEKEEEDKEGKEGEEEKKTGYCKWVTKGDEKKEKEEAGEESESEKELKEDYRKRLKAEKKEEAEGKKEEEKETEEEKEEKEEETGNCRPNLDYEYGPMDDPMLFNAYADAQECWKKEEQATCFGRGCAWRGTECHYAVPNTTSHGILVKYMPSTDCGWFAKLERPRKCQTFSLEECPMEMEPCTNGTAFIHHEGDEYCEPTEVCAQDNDKAMDFLCEEPLKDVYLKCFTETKGYTGNKQQAKELECLHKECPDFAAMMEFNYKATKLCPRYHGEVEPCERQSNCSYNEEKSMCEPDPSTMMLERVPKSCRYYDSFKKKKKCTTTLADLCTKDDCEWIESTPCTGNDTVPKFECDVKSNVYLRTVLDNTDDDHLLTFIQAVTAKEICLASTHEQSCKETTPMDRKSEDKGASSRPDAGALCKFLVIAIISFGGLTSLFS